MGKKWACGFHKLYDNYKRMAAKRGISFELTKDIFFDLVISPCSYCGMVQTNRTVHRRPLNRGGARSVFLSVGVDRVDNSKGYEEGNCVPCCKFCNQIKSDHSVEFLKCHLTKMLRGLG